jgi:peptidoglycan/xylan/chitin deacetylase (PgdA/CDA1 family)
MLSKIGSLFFPKAIFSLPVLGKKMIYLTFDDGPTPEITPWVFEILEKNHIKATFFLLGTEVVKFPEIMSLYHSKGHKIGNHGFEHLDGWKNNTDDYIQNILENKKHIPSRLFRPPYGRITPAIYKTIQNQFKIIFWNKMIGDFKQKTITTSEINHFLQKLKNGDILVLHDNKKSFHNLKLILPIIIEYGIKNNFEFGILEN